MNNTWVISTVVAGILSACGVLMVIVLVCIAIRPRQVSQNPERATPRRTMIHSVSEAEAWRMAVRVNDEELDIILQLAEAELAASQIDVTAGVLAWLRPANCVASVNPDGSVAVARELVVENKSAV